MYCQTWKVEEITPDGGSKLIPLHRNRAEMFGLLNCSPRQFGRYLKGEPERGWIGLIKLCPELRFNPKQKWFTPEQQAALYYYATCIKQGAVKQIQDLINKQGFPHERANELFKSASN